MEQTERSSRSRPVYSNIDHGAEAETNVHGRFNFKALHDYISNKQYPSAFSKDDKQTLRKRAQYFISIDGQLYYTGGELSM